MDCPLVSVIVVNWNGKEYVGETVLSLLQQDYPNREIIVVDNASTDGSYEFIRDTFGNRVQLIRRTENTGFAKGNNCGIRVAKGKYMFLLNNDAVAEKSWITELVKIGEENPDAGMCACKVLNYFEHDTIDTVGHLIYRDGLNRGRGRLEKDSGQYDRIEEVFFPSGAAALYRKAMLDEIGLLDENFFAYGEDADIGIRGRLAGWKCIYVPRAVVYHRYSGSTCAYSPLKAFLVERNRIWVALKNFPISLLLLNPFYTIQRYFWQAYGVFSKKGATGKYIENYSRSSLLLILLKANVCAVAGAFHMYKKRYWIKKITKVSRREILSWFKTYAIAVKSLSLRS